MPVVLPTKKKQQVDQAISEIEETKDSFIVRIEAMKWGMMNPSVNNLVINGRLEEICSKPFFRGLLEQNRCVLTFNGYYEWKVVAGGASSRKPYLFVPSTSP